MNAEFRKHYNKVKKLSKTDLAFPSPATVKAVYELFKAHDWLHIIRSDEDKFRSGFSEYIIVLYYANKNILFKEMYNDFKQYASNVIDLCKQLPPKPKPKLQQYRHK